MSCIQLKLDPGWELQLKNFINWERDTMERLEVVMKEVQKENFPDTTMTTNLFYLQALQAGESHLELLRKVSSEFEFDGVRRREISSSLMTN